MGYIYILTSPSGKSYIGQTFRSIEKRFEAHQQKSSNCVAIYRAIKKYGWGNFEKDYYECSDEDLNFDEELLIREMETLAPDGYNLKTGGDSGRHSEESRQKMSESRLGEKNYMYGKTGEKHPSYGTKRSEETRQKQSKAQLGIPMSEEAKQKLSEAKRGEKHPDSKRVYQYARDGTFIESFASTGEAGRYLKKDGTSIAACARGAPKYKTAHGFKWSYVKY